MIRRGDVCLVNFARARGSEQAGQRPALIIQSDVGNEYSATTIIAAMSTSRAEGYPFRVSVSPGDSGLREQSTVLLDELLTVSVERLGRRLGHLSPHVIEQVDRAIHHSLGLIG